jgi:nucleoside-diphosphate-sugar epimerase
MPPRYEPLHLARQVAAGEVRSGVGTVAREWLAAARVIPPGDPYSVSMRDSLAAFHSLTRDGSPELGAKAGSEVVAICEEVTREVAGAEKPSRKPARKRQPAKCDALVLGGTGFIGAALVEQMLAAGMSVRVMARNVGALPSLFDHKSVQVAQGNVTDADATDRAIKGADVVVHLAHGGSFEWEDVESTVIEPAERIADACLEHGVGRLLYAGSISSLYIGDPGAVITGATPNDPRIREQGAYGFGKARSEEVLLERVREHALDLCILRPAIVVGAGGRPLHPGVGEWRADLHCIGWNRGTNPLPFVLASDVAAAFLLALESDVAIGKTYNLVGGVRPSAREYVAELRDTLGRPFTFRPRNPARRQALHASKWVVKRLLGRHDEFPSSRGTKSLGFVSPFDCSDVESDLGWTSVADRDEFLDRGIRVHAQAVS